MKFVDDDDDELASHSHCFMYSQRCLRLSKPEHTGTPFRDPEI